LIVFVGLEAATLHFSLVFMDFSKVFIYFSIVFIDGCHQCLDVSMLFIVVVPQIVERHWKAVDDKFGI
jgi:hypothetical protein